MQKPFVLPVQTVLGKYIYEVNRNEIIKVNEELFNYIKAIVETDDPQSVKASEEIKMQFAELQDFGYLSAKKVKFIEHSATRFVEDYLDRKIEKITLQITQDCNLRCKYCIYSEGANLDQRKHSYSTMSFETAKKSIDFYRMHSRDTKQLAIGFYGGEPLLEFPLIVDVVHYAEEVFEGREIIFAVTTNATLLTEEKIDFMLDHNFVFTLSIDGPKKVHDKNRVFSNGIGSYDRIINNINKFCEKDPRKLKDTSINMVIDSAQDYEELLSLFDEPALQNVSMRYSFVEKDSFMQPPSENFITKYEYDKFLSLFAYLRGEKTNYLNKIMKQCVQSFDFGYNRFTTSVLQPLASPSGPCVPGKLRLLVNCFGEFYPCEKVNENNAMNIGNLDKGFDYYKVRTILNVGQIESEACKSCWAISLCSMCARGLDDGKKLSVEKRYSSCKDSKEMARKKILEKILVFENDQHLRDISKWSV